MEINGKRVVDATRKAKIMITKRDTVEGDNKNPSSCAAARAAKRDVPECLSARVHIGRVYIEQKDKWVRYYTPEALRTEIIAFDRGGTFQPGEYELKPPSKSESEAGRRKSYFRSNVNRNKLGASPTKSPRRKIRVAKIKRHEVSGIRPKGAVR
jgi:hypothetical protein